MAGIRPLALMRRENADWHNLHLPIVSSLLGDCNRNTFQPPQGLLLVQACRPPIAMSFKIPPNNVLLHSHILANH